jgi:hypothetical protein
LYRLSTIVWWHPIQRERLSEPRVGSRTDSEFTADDGRGPTFSFNEKVTQNIQAISAGEV